jgi:SSS family solute:Na+ symporter
LSVWKLLGWWLIAAWTIVDPAFHQRCAAAQDPATARRGILVSIGFWALFDLMTTGAGLCARALMPDLDAPLAAFPALADALLPSIPRGLFLAGLAASVFAGLQATLLVAAASLGRDGWLRFRRDEDERGRARAARAGIAAAVALSLLLARLLPSVVALWYSVGSATIPGLLLPMLGVYYAPLRVAGPWALASSLTGWLVSTAWAIAAARGETPLGLEPMLPGLAASALIWGAGLYASRAAQLAPSRTPQAPQ